MQRANGIRGSDVGAKSLRMHGTIARDLGREIVSGRMQPGALLDSEIVASKLYGVSRATYREAVRILVAKGLVEARPKAGTRVSEEAVWQLLDPDVLAWIFSSEPRQDLIAHLFELRRVIEPAAASLAAGRRSFAQLGRMEAALKEMEGFTLADERGRAADGRFHSVLLEASGNPFLATLSDGICAAVGLATMFRLDKSPVQRDPVPDHWRVFEAIAAGDAERASACMTMLIDRTYVDTKGG